ARPRMARMASSVLAWPSARRKRPRTLRSASLTSLRRMIRPPSSSTLRIVPLVSPRASRTAFGSVIWPRSATVASIGLAPVSLGMHGTYILFLSYSIWHTRGLPKEPPHDRFLRHPRPPRRQRQVLRLFQPAQARRAFRPGEAALLDEDPLGEPAAP